MTETRLHGTNARLFVDGRDVGPVANWELVVARDYVDATVFGDTNRTYLVGQQLGTTFTGWTGDEPVRFFWNRHRTDAPAEPRHQLTIETNTTPPINVAPTGTVTFRDDLYRDYAARFRDLYGQTYATPMPGADAANVLKQAEEEKLAREKAAKLLRRMLTPEQLAEFEVDQAFTIKGKKVVYRISASGVVTTISPRGSFCASPYIPGTHKYSRMPGPDKALAAKLLIEHDEQEFLRTANWTSFSTSRTGSVHLGELTIDGKGRNRAYESNVYGHPGLKDAERYPGGAFVFPTYAEMYRME